MSTSLSEKKVDISRGSITIFGVGNRLLGDEGIGPSVIDNLSRMHLPPYVDIVDCGCDLLGSMSYQSEPQKIIIVDAIRAGGKPGEIYRFYYSKLATMQDKTGSGHQIGTIDVLRLLKLVYPVLANSEITVIGMEPKSLELGNNLSQEVKEKIADVTRLVIEEISPKSSTRRVKDRVLQNRFCTGLFRPRKHHSSHRPGPGKTHTDAGKAQSYIYQSGSEQRVDIMVSRWMSLTCGWDLANI